MPKSLKKNFAFNLINSVTGLLFPFITFPYASRIMGAAGIGQVNFYNSIISYIILFAGLGIPLYAVREIARVRDDKYKMNKTFLEIFSLHSFLTIIGYIIVLILCFTVPRIHEGLPLFLLLSLSIGFTTIGCEWFYQGIEDFKYITIRGLCFRISAIAILFIFVRSSSDIMWYGAYCVFGTVGNNVFNFVHLRKFLYIKQVKLKKIRPFKHLRAVSLVFILTAVSTIYISLNTIILGFMTTNANVGYYTTGIKFFTMVFGMVNALTTTVIPRISNIIAHKEYDKLGEMAQKLYRFTVGVTLPMVVGLIIVSPYLIVVFCGDGFRPSILVSQITAPLILVVGLSSVFGMQILYPMGKIKIMIKSAAFASIVDLLIVVLLTKNLREDATAIGYLCAEITATCSEVLLGKNFIPIKLRDKHLLLYVIGSAIMALGLYFISLTNLSNIIMVIVMCVVGIIIYGIILMLRKDFIYLSIRNMVLKRVVRHA